MFRALVTAAALGLAVVTATTAPASAASAELDECFSFDLRCQGYECQSGTKIFDNGVNDTGPWLVLCT